MSCISKLWIWCLVPSCLYYLSTKPFFRDRSIDLHVRLTITNYTIVLLHAISCAKSQFAQMCYCTLLLVQNHKLHKCATAGCFLCKITNVLLQAVSCVKSQIAQMCYGTLFLVQNHKLQVSAEPLLVRD